MALSAQQILVAARMRAKKIQPYLADAVIGLIPREAQGLGTLAVTDSMILLWDPARVLAWGTECTAWVLLHEAAHPLRKHGARGKQLAADPVLWCLATDSEINDDLQAMPGCALPDGCITPKSLGLKDGLLAESYYHQLRQQNAQQTTAAGAEQPGQGAGPPRAPSQGPDKPAAAEGWCGSGGGREVPGEPTDKAGGRSEADVQRIRQQVAEAVKKHASQGRGNMAGGWLAWADEVLLPPKINWQDKLGRVVRGAIAHRAGSADYTYARPSRRQGVYGYGPRSPIRPSMHAPIPRVVVGVDTSGSMGLEGIQRAASEVAGILKAVKAEVEFIACDCEIHEQRKIKKVSEIMASMKGGGGTSFIPAFEAAAKKRPGAFIFITDGVGEAPAEQPKGIGRVVWVLVNGHDKVGIGIPITYGEIVKIEAEKPV